MFQLVTVEDTIVIPARYFGKPRTKAIENVINKHMSDRVIPGIGLVVAVWDLLRIGDDKLTRHTGDAATDCRFRLLVFAPFVGEVIPARIGPSTEAGILAYLRFFNLVWVPSLALPKPSSFDENDKVWTWHVPSGDENEQGSDEGVVENEGASISNFMDGGNETVVRVTAVQYDESGRGSGGGTAYSAIGARPGGYSMVIKASMYDEVSEDNQGLGDPAWWYEEGDEEEAGEEGVEGEEADGEEVQENEEGYEGQGGDEAYEQGEAGEDWGEAGVDDELIHEGRGEAAVDAAEPEE